MTDATQRCGACLLDDCDRCRRAARRDDGFYTCCCGRTVLGARIDTTRSPQPFTDAQTDGRACVRCGLDFTTSRMPAVPVVDTDGEPMRGPGGTQMFRCESRCGHAGGDSW